jgi:hypothetical protein
MACGCLSCSKGTTFFVFFSRWGGSKSPFTPEKKAAPLDPKSYMRNGFTAGFCHFLGTIKIWIKKKLFVCEKICKFFEKEKNVIKKKKTKKLF